MAGPPAASTVTRRGATIPPSRASASSSSSRKSTVLGRSSSAPASRRVMSRRLETSRARRSDCSSMSSSSSARSSGLRRASTWRILDTAVLMEASGVRRSCEAAPMRARRQRSISSSRRARRACSRSCARSTASAAWLANVPSRLRSRSTSCTSWSTSMPTGRWLTTSATETRRGPASSSSPRELAWPPPDVTEATSLAVRGWPALAATRSAAPDAGGPPSPSGNTKAVQRGAKTDLHGCHHVGQQLRQAEVADQRLRQLVQPFRLLGATLRLLAGGPQLGHHLGHDQHDQRRRPPARVQFCGERTVRVL